MRRPLLIIFTIFLVLAYINTNNDYIKDVDSKNDINVEGIVKSIRETENYDEYKVNKILVRDYSKIYKLIVGSKLIIQGQFKSAESIESKEFDYSKYIKSRGYKGILYIKGYEIVGQDYFYTKLGEVEKYVKESLRYLYKRNSDFINSLILGKKDYLSNEEKDMFTRTGINHIIAISGLHTGILCSIMILIVGGVNRVYKLILLSIIISIYSILVGNSPSIIRAIIFSVLMYISFFIDRKNDNISNLSFVGILLIINNPYIIYNISFQLSFLATLSIIYFYDYINKHIKFSLLSLTLSANILTLPIIYYNFKGISLVSIIGNIIAVPIVGIIIYLSIISVVLFNFNIYLAKVAASINIDIIDCMYILLEKLSKLEFAYIEFNSQNIYCVIIYYIFIFSYMIYKEKKTIKEQKNELQGYYKEYKV